MKESKNDVPAVIQQRNEKTLQEELEDLLSQLDGAGRVKVLLTESAGERMIFQTNDNTEQSENAGRNGYSFHLFYKRGPDISGYLCTSRTDNRKNQ